MNKMEKTLPLTSSLTVAILILVLVVAGIYSLSNQAQPLQQTLSLTVKFLPAQQVKLAARGRLLDPSELVLTRAPLPSSVNLYTTSWGKPVQVDDQGPFGSCTAHALRYAWQLWRRRTGQAVFLPSRCFWYALSRARMGDTNYAADNGSTNEDSVAVLIENGAIQETEFPYSKANISRAPSSTLLTKAKAFKAPSSVVKPLNYSSSADATITLFKQALALGKPVITAILVYTSFMSSSTLRSGTVPSPNLRTERLLGGHAVTITGYNDTARVFMFRNSWGSRVGQRGSFTIPYTYVANPRLAGDAWILG